MALPFYFLLTAAVTAVGIMLYFTLREEKVYRLAFCILAFVTLGSISAFRYDVGYDYSYIYLPLYAPVLNDPFVSSAGLVHEAGFVLLERIIAIASPDPQTLFIVTGYLIAGLFMLYYYLYSPGPVVSVFLFISLGQFYCSMNFIRQTLAGVICLFALPLLQRRKFWHYCAVVLLASLFHTSALIMLVFYFVNLIPVNGYTLLIYVPASIILYLSSSGMLELVTQYAYGHYGESGPAALGFPLTSLAVLVFLFAFLFLNRKRLTKRDERNYVYLNYAFFSLMFMFLGTRHAILNRFALFFELAVPVGFAVLLAEWRKEYPSWLRLLKNAKSNLPGARRDAVVYAACILAVFGGSTGIHHYILTQDSHGVIPYKLIFDQPFYKNGLGFGEDDGAPLEEPDEWAEDSPWIEPEDGEAADWREDGAWMELPDDIQ